MSRRPRSLDDLVAVLADTNPMLDEATDERVASRLFNEQKERQHDSAKTTNPSRSLQGRRWGLFAFTSTLAVAAVASVAIWKSQPVAPVLISDPAIDANITPREPPPPPVSPRIDFEELRNTAQTTLRAALRETEPAVRALGADALAKIKDQDSVPPLSALTEKDPDASVRSRSAEALSILGAKDTAAQLADLEKAAPLPLKVWYASALARLGDRGAGKRLLKYADDKDLAVAFKAGLSLAEVSQPGDEKTLAALRAIAAREAELNEIQPYAGVLILTKMAALRDLRAREVLYSILENTDEGARLAAAEGLAKLGDDAGKKILQEVLANRDSPNQLVAAIAQLPLGEYGGLGVISKQLDDKDPVTRRLAARGLGEIGERTSLPALIQAAQDKDWTVRIAASAAIFAIVGLDPQVLAQASVDWTKTALDSQDLAVRKAAAGVLADIPEKQAVPLLAQAIADPDRNVRLAASRSAGKMKGAEAAAKVVAAVATETDPQVKEQQVTALGEIGRTEARATLAKISEEPGRIGVIAAGSLIAVGDTAGNAKLEAAVASPTTELRLAAVQAASMTKNKIVVPTLTTGVKDRVFEVRFAAAEGLAGFNAERLLSVPVLTAALESKDATIAGRALSALTRLGEPVKDTVPTPAEMIASPDPRQRLAAVQVVRAMPVKDSVPLLRRLVADQDQDVRRAGVDAIEDVSDKDQAIKLYKPLVNSADAVVRSKASGQLARLVPTPRDPPKGDGRDAGVAAAGPDAGVADAGPVVPVVDNSKVVAARDAARTAADALKSELTSLQALTAEVTAATAIPAKDDDDPAIDRVKALKKQLKDSDGKLDQLADQAEAAATTAATEARAASSSTPEATALVEEATKLAKEARRRATDARDTLAEATKKTDRYIATEYDDDPTSLLDATEAAIAVRDFPRAKRNLDKAAKLISKSKTKTPRLDDLQAQYYDGYAKRTDDPAAKRALLLQAQEAYQRLARTGNSAQVKRANARLTEMVENKELE